jgi:hypothetical protein
MCSCGKILFAILVMPISSIVSIEPFSLPLLICPTCGSASKDNSQVCGVCGRSLSGVSQKSENDVQAQYDAKVRAEHLDEIAFDKKIRRKKIIRTVSLLAAGVLSLLLGFIVIGQFGNIYGVLLVVMGMLVILIGVSYHSMRRYPMRRL